MNRQKLVSLITLSIVIVSCNNTRKDITLLHYEKLPVESNIYTIPEGCYENIFILDSFLVLTARCDDDEKIIHVYDKKNIQLIKKFGAKGSAPFEFASVRPYNNATITEKNDSIHFYDVVLWQDKIIDLQKIISGGKEEDYIFSSPMDNNLFFTHNLTILDNNQLAGASADESNGLFFIYDTQKKVKKWIEYNPKISIDKKHKKSVYSGVINANVSENSIIYASRYFDQIFFYDLDGNITKEYYFSEIKNPELSSAFSGVVNESIVYNVDIYATSKYCFVFRICQSMIDILNHPKQTAQIIVFSWDGSIVNAFELSIIPELFCYDDEFGYLYFLKISQDEDDPFVNIIKYDMNELLHKY